MPKTALSGNPQRIVLSSERLAEQESNRDPFIRILVIRQKLYIN